MQALLQLVSPERKRAKTTEIELSDGSDSELQADEDMMGTGHRKVQSDGQEKVPCYIQAQNDTMDKLMTKIMEIQNNIGSIREEVSQIRFQSGVAQAVAEDAMDKIDDLETRVFAKLSALESQIRSITTIETMIQ